MQSASVTVLPTPARIRPRTALVASADRSFRQRLTHILTGLRWQVREAEGGAQAWAEAENSPVEAVIVDSWLPDLDVNEFLKDFRGSFPNVDLLAANGAAQQDGPRGPYRQELLYAMRRSQDTDTAAWNTAPALNAPSAQTERWAFQPQAMAAHSAAAAQTAAAVAANGSGNGLTGGPMNGSVNGSMNGPAHVPVNGSANGLASASRSASPTLVRGEPAMRSDTAASERLPELIGNAPCMIEVSRRVRLVAPRMTPVLIEGPTGSGKELVAEAVHRLSARSRSPFVAINCAAIPESLLEAELFGHTRGAFTGAVQGRTGRIEAADGGTLFLDEIGEMPLALQSKLLRFVECGELQRVGDNEVVKVQVRILAATHRPLAEHAQSGTFRSDLYYRLAVFLIRTPSLSEHSEDLPLLVDHFLQQMGRDTPVKRLDETAMAKLAAHDWPGNVRELEHVLERGIILAGDEPVLTASDIDFGRVVN
jgi:DNA-binding NtrC family response regulator